MSKKNSPDKHGFVYSTDPNFRFEEESREQGTQPPAQQKLRILLDKKQRAGKSVTLVEGFRGTNEDLETLSRQLRSFCGTGGSAKDGYIIVQGDQRKKVMQWLKTNGYSQSKEI